MYTRTVTNIGEANASYIMDILSPHGVNIIVKPCSLDFSELNENLKFKVIFSKSDMTSNVISAQRYILWKSSKYSVRNPIVVIKADL